MNPFFRVKWEWSPSSCPVFLNYAYDDRTSWEHVCHTGQLNRNDPMCFTATAYFSLQVLVLVFVRVIALPLKMCCSVSCKTPYSYGSWLGHCHLLSLWDVMRFGPFHHRESQSLSVKCQVYFSGASWWGPQWFTRNNVSSWPTLFLVWSSHGWNLRAFLGLCSVTPICGTEKCLHGLWKCRNETWSQTLSFHSKILSERLRAMPALGHPCVSMLLERPCRGLADPFAWFAKCVARLTV